MTIRKGIRMALYYLNNEKKMNLELIYYTNGLADNSPPLIFLSDVFWRELQFHKILRNVDFFLIQLSSVLLDSFNVRLS